MMDEYAGNVAEAIQGVLVSHDAGTMPAHSRTFRDARNHGAGVVRLLGMAAAVSRHGIPSSTSLSTMGCTLPGREWTYSEERNVEERLHPFVFFSDCRFGGGPRQPLEIKEAEAFHAMLLMRDFVPMPTTLHFDWDLPEGALREPFVQDLVDTIKREATLRLFADGKISSGYAAKMLGIQRQEFLDLASERQIPLTAYGPGDLAAELAALDPFIRVHRTK